VTVEERIATMRARHRVERTLDEALSTKLRRRGTSVHSVLDLADVGSRLEKFLSTQLTEPFTVQGVRRLPGGASKEQFLFTLARGGEHERLVLRMSPPASVLETHRLREFQVLRAVRGLLPVPSPRWLIEDPALLGGPALI
jgi:aminoglycoside phosphotransferase (APT) family kinase protein